MQKTKKRTNVVPPRAARAGQPGMTGQRKLHLTEVRTTTLLALFQARDEAARRANEGIDEVMKLYAKEAGFEGSGPLMLMSDQQTGRFYLGYASEINQQVAPPTKPSEPGPAVPSVEAPIPAELPTEEQADDEEEEEDEDGQ